MIQKKSKKASTLQEKKSALSQSPLSSQRPLRLLHRDCPGTYHHCSTVAAKEGTPNLSGDSRCHSILGPFVTKVLFLSSNAAGSMLCNSWLPEFSHLISTILRQHLLFPPFENEEMKLKGLCYSSGVTEMVRNRAGGNLASDSILVFSQYI